MELSQLDPKVEIAARDHEEIEQAVPELTASVERPQDWIVRVDEHGHLRANHEGSTKTAVEDGALVWDGTTWQLMWRSP